MLDNATVLIVRHLMKVILSDGDFSTLSNMKINLDLNHIESNTELEEGMFGDPFVVSYLQFLQQYSHFSCENYFSNFMSLTLRLVIRKFREKKVRMKF